MRTFLPDRNLVFLTFTAAASGGGGGGCGAVSLWPDDIDCLVISVWLIRPRVEKQENSSIFEPWSSSQ